MKSRKHDALLSVFLLLTGLASIYGTEEGSIKLGQIILENATTLYSISRNVQTFGAASFDINKDNWPDLFISNHGLPPTVLVNQGGKGFSSAAGSFPRLSASDRHAPAFADCDNDGDQDLYVQHGARSGTGFGPKEFFSNQPQHYVRKFVQPISDPLARGRTAIWFDYNNDGLLDLLTINDLRENSPNRLFLNLGNQSFTDISAESGLNISMHGLAGIAADVDSDTDMDLVLIGKERPYLMVLGADGVYRDEAELRGLPIVPGLWAAAATDFDGDGNLDLYLASGTDGDLEGATMGPHRLNYMHTVGSSDRVDMLTFRAPAVANLFFEYSNTINHTYIDMDNIFVGAQGITPAHSRFRVGPGAINAKGRPVQWADDGSRKGTFLWYEEATGYWTIATAAGSSDSFVTGGMVTSVANMGSLTLTQMEKPAIPDFPNYLLRNLGNGTFARITQDANAQDFSNTHSPVWIDLDNDSDEDLFLVNAGFNGHGNQANVCLVNHNGVFTRHVLPMTLEERFGRGDGAVVDDFDGNGYLDLFITNGSGLLPNSEGPYKLLLNRTALKNSWLQIRLVGGGAGMTNRDGIGTKVHARITSPRRREMWRFLNGGSGSVSQSSRILHFGLADARTLDIEIHWPSSRTFPNGHLQHLHFSQQDFNRIHVVAEPR